MKSGIPIIKRKHKYLYDHGLPFSEKLGENYKDIYERVYDLGKAGLIIIDGGIGEGKTTKGIHTVDFFNKLAGVPPMDIESKKQIGLGGADFSKKLIKLFKSPVKYPVIIYDEAGDFNRRGALTRFNAMLNRTFETYRAFKIIVILILPSFHVLDSDLFDKNIPRLLIHCEKRTKTTGNFKAYSLYRMMYIKDKMKRLVVKPFAYNITTPNFYGHFLDLPPERSKILDRVSTTGKIEQLETAEIVFEGLLSNSDLCKKMLKSSQWVRMARNHLGIKHKKIFKNVRYFEADVLDRLIALEESGTFTSQTRSKGVKNEI